MPAIDALLTQVLDIEASDLHLTSTFPPYVRIHGDMQPLEGEKTLTPEDTRAILEEIMPEANRAEFAETKDTDFGYAIPERARFRVNVFADRHGVGGVLRQIPSKVPSADDLNLPQAVRQFCSLSKGLVVVTGPTGSGKSTTLAAMVDLVNQRRAEHIITIEDPIEFVHTPQKCLINQREVHMHTKSFASALRAALREDPDIVLVGEMRDLETTEIAIETAETGHLVFSTLHTNTAISTVNRIVDKFPAERQNQIRMMLADALKGVVAQTLCKRIAGGRVSAMEVLVATTGIASNIREGKTHQIGSAMQTGRKLGMQTLNDALIELVKAGVVSPEEAHLKSIDKNAFAVMVKEAGLPLDLPDFSAPGAKSGPGDRTWEDVKRIREWRAILEKEPENAEMLNNLAWMLATNPNDDLRNGQEAVKLAERAAAIPDGLDRVSVLDTAAAAYAETGRCAEALKLAQEALRLARKKKRPQATELLEKAVSFYEQGKPFRDE